MARGATPRSLRSAIAAPQPLRDHRRSARRIWQLPAQRGDALLAERGEVVLGIIGECRTVADPGREDVQ